MMSEPSISFRVNLPPVGLTGFYSVTGWFWALEAPHPRGEAKTGGRPHSGKVTGAGGAGVLWVFFAFS